MKARRIGMLAGTCAAVLIVYFACLKSGNRPHVASDPSKENIAPFAKQTLDLDLENIALGKPFRVNGSNGIVNPVFGNTTNAVALFTNAVSARYHETYANRTLLFGVRKGKLEMILIEVEMDQVQFGPLTAQPVVTQTTNGQWIGSGLRNKDLVSIRNALKTAAAAHGKHLSFTDGRFQVRYDAICSTRDEDPLIRSTVQISLADTK